MSGSRGSITLNGTRVDKLINVTRALERIQNDQSVRVFGENLSAGPNGTLGVAGDPFEQLMRSLLASSSQVATLDRRVRDLRDVVSELNSRVAKLSEANKLRLAQVAKLNDKQNGLVIKLKRNECFDEETGEPVCKNGAPCVDQYDSFKCLCPSQFEGKQCELDVDECAKFGGTELGCQNGARCVNLVGSYKCECPAQHHGTSICRTGEHCQLAS